MTREAPSEMTGIVKADLGHDFFHTEESRLDEHARFVHAQHLEVPCRRDACFHAEEQREPRRRKVDGAREVGDTNWLVKGVAHLLDRPGNANIRWGHADGNLLKLAATLRVD